MKYFLHNRRSYHQPILVDRTGLVAWFANSWLICSPPSAFFLGYFWGLKEYFSIDIEEEVEQAGW